MKQIAGKINYESNDIEAAQMILEEYYQNFAEFCKNDANLEQIKTFVQNNNLPLNITDQMNDCQIVGLIYVIIQQTLIDAFNEQFQQNFTLQLPQIINNTSKMTHDDYQLTLDELSNTNTSVQLQTYKNKVKYGQVNNQAIVQQVEQIQQYMTKYQAKIQTQIMQIDKNTVKYTQKLSKMIEQVTTDFQSLQNQIKQMKQDITNIQEQQQNIQIDMRSLQIKSRKRSDTPQINTKSSKDDQQMENMMKIIKELQKDVDDLKKENKELKQKIESQQSRPTFLPQLTRQSSQLSQRSVKQQIQQEKSIQQKSFQSTQKSIKEEQSIKEQEQDSDDSFDS